MSPSPPGAAALGRPGQEAPELAEHVERQAWMVASSCMPSDYEALKRLFFFPDDSPDKEFLDEFRDVTRRVCKPCWELKYCPYGDLIENYPRLPITRADRERDAKIARKFLDAGEFPDGWPLDEKYRASLNRTIHLAQELPEGTVESIPKFIRDTECRDGSNGRVCPVFFEFDDDRTETSEYRRVGRTIPFNTRMRVARRDNYTCQHCGKHLADSEIEFDHIIPVSRGGSSDEHNLRLTCRTCNRRKSDHVDHDDVEVE